ncbi:MAG TPA: nucleotide sugar dehydrogenase [Acidobacteriota bacterium]|nr:nucleotide sugar dehydrogenase [Acidobacteriota bacterium]
MDLKQKILKRKAEIGIVGLGYVGLPLAMEFVASGFTVHGIDLNGSRVDCINRGVSHVLDVPTEVLQKAVESGRFKAYPSYSIVSDLDCVIICVPTPLRHTKDPDMSHIISATEQISRRIHKNMLIVLQSTTYPGTTDELLVPELKADHLEIGRDLFVAFSPERVDPGNPKYNTRNTPKIVGGVTPRCTEMAKTLYEQAIDHVIPVSSTATAEMVKLLENTFRAVNIGLVNEIAIICEKLGVSVWEVIQAAASKPFGFMPFYPGPGLGGHCIPIDPLYLSWKLKAFNYNARFIELASDVNTHMPEYCVQRIHRILNKVKKCVNGSRILILGVAYKPDITDVRESPALDIIRLLQIEGATVDFADPYVPEIDVQGHSMKSVTPAPETLATYDLAVVVTNHSCFDYDMIQANAPLIFDTRNAYKKGAENVFKL